MSNAKPSPGEIKTASLLDLMKLPNQEFKCTMKMPKSLFVAFKEQTERMCRMRGTLKVLNKQFKTTELASLIRCIDQYEKEAKTIMREHLKGEKANA